MRHFLSAALAGLALLAACQSAPSQQQPAMSALPAYQTDKFRLSASPGAADGYTATIDEARFITSIGSFPVPWGHTLTSGWGGSAIGWAVGDDMQAAPDSLEIRWFSYAEDKFYEGHFLLPQQRIHALLKQGFYNPETKQQETYDDLAVCVVPTGVVVVWLRGANWVLIGRYQGREIQYDYARHRPHVDRAADVAETRAAMPAAIRAEIAAGTVSSKRWDNYLKTYPWKLAFSQPLTLTEFGMGFVNAEDINLPLTPDSAAYAQTVLAPSVKPVPKDAMLYVAGAYGRKRLFKVETFDEAETMAAFQALHARHPAEPITLYVDTDERLSKATLSLRAGAQIIPLPKSRVEVFDL